MKEQSSLDFITDCIHAIQSDSALKESFIQVLSMGSSTQQVRVHRLLEAIKDHNAPEPVIRFVQMLSDDKLAHKVLSVLEESP